MKSVLCNALMSWNRNHRGNAHGASPGRATVRGIRPCGKTATRAASKICFAKTMVVVCLSSLFSMSAFSSVSHDWPMWGYDAARTGLTPMELPAELHLQWRRDMPAPRRAWPEQFDDMDKLDFDKSYSPVTLGDKLFVASMVSDKVTAYRIEDGAEVWRHYVDGPVRLAPAAWNGKVYFVSDDGRLYCVSAETGARLWSFNAAPADSSLVLGNNRIVSMWPARGGPVVKDGAVYFAAGVWPFMGTFVYALDAETGEEIWRNTGEAANWQRQPHGGAFSFAGIAPQGYIAATEDRLVVSGGRSTPALLDRATGELLYLDIFGKGPGGYRVQADDEFFYTHGAKNRLEDGRPYGRGSIVHEQLHDMAKSLADQLDGPVFNIIAARGRVLVTTVPGTIYSFSGAAQDSPVVHEYSVSPVMSREDAESALAAQERGAAMLKQAVSGGYALLLGVGDGTLLEQLAIAADMHVVGIDPDEQKIAKLRLRLDQAGLYGVSVSLLPGNPAEIKYPPYISSLIVVEDPGFPGLEPDDIYALLRPYGGKAFIGTDTVLSRDGPLPGAGEWTHQYADASRTGVSRDDLVRLPLGILWYGTTDHDNILPRHAAGPRPQVAGGRLAIMGVETLSARDVYTGRELWVRDFPGIGHPFTHLELEARWMEGESVYMSNIPGAAYIGSPYVTLPDSIYIRYRGRVFRLDPDTGDTLAEIPLYPDTAKIDSDDWGPVIVAGNLLITTTGPHQIESDAKPPPRSRGTSLGWLEDWSSTSSRNLIVMDRISGETLWARSSDVGFRHNAIVTGPNRVFVIDGLSEKALEFLARRGTAPETDSRVIALDAMTGKILWETDSEVFGTYLAYSEEHDILLESGSRDTRRPLPDEPVSRVVARRGSDGSVIWDGNLQFPAAIRGEVLIPARPGRFLNLLTGEPVTRYHPVTGEEIEENYAKSYGCGPLNASTHMLLFRSGAAGFTDLEHDGGTGNFGGFRSGCTANLIAADGIINAPDYTRTCRCSYQNQTSLGLVHDPNADIWTSVNLGRGSGDIRRVGVNLGAPGNRMAENGTLWVPFPGMGAPAPELDIIVGTGVSGIVEAEASSTEQQFGSMLDDNLITRWIVYCDGNGRFDHWIRYDLSETITLDNMEAAWTGPEGTEFKIETSADGENWKAVVEEKGRGHGHERFEYRFEPVQARHVRLVFGGHDDKSVDRAGARRRRAVRLSRLRIGSLPYPEAYSGFIQVEFPVYRKHALEIDGTEGLNWVSASGVPGVRQFIFSGISGQEHPYTVIMHFAEPENIEPGDRVFDISIQGKRVAEQFDIASVAGGSNRAVTKTFEGVVIGRQLRIYLDSKKDAELGPVLSGVELVRE